MTKRINRRTISANESKYFIGEIMTCRICGKQQRSNIKKESDWTVVEVNGQPQYFCPVCFGVPGYQK